VYHTHTRTKNATEKLAENTNLGINSTKKFKSKCPEGCVVSMSYLCMHKAINIIQKIISWCPRQDEFLLPSTWQSLRASACRRIFIISPIYI